MADDVAERTQRQQRSDDGELIDIDDPDHVSRADIEIGGNGGQRDIGDHGVERAHRQRGEDREHRPSPLFPR
jgi:hypothetical protein